MDNLSRIHQLPNGMVVIAEPMPWLESVAFNFAVRAGGRFDPPDRLGLANFVCEMVQRGAGDMNSRQFLERLEHLGVDYGSSVTNDHTHFYGALCADQLSEAISIYADVLRRPTLPADQVEDARRVCFQEIAGLEDDLASQVMNALYLLYFGDPDGRDVHGTMESVARITADDIGDFFAQYYRPDELILAVAGNVEWDALIATVQELFGDWSPVQTPEPEIHPGPHGTIHIPFESQQTHIALAFPSFRMDDPLFYHASAQVGILSAGMSSRLFHEVREKRGLCYSVYASLQTSKTDACVACYSGTTTERAQETLDVIMRVLSDLSRGTDDDELERLKVQVRTSIVMSQESCRGRTSGLVSDYFYLGRVRSLDEINKGFAGLTVDSMNQFLAEHPPGPFDLATLGAQPLELQHDGITRTST